MLKYVGNLKNTFLIVYVYFNVGMKIKKRQINEQLRLRNYLVK